MPDIVFPGAPGSPQTGRLLSSAEVTKLTNIQANATANPNAVDSDITGLTGGQRIENIVFFPDDEDLLNLGTYVQGTLYVTPSASS